MAVRLEVGERLVPPWRRVHGDPVDERIELDARQVEGRNERLQGLALGRQGRLGREDALDFASPERERFLCPRRIRLQIDRIVDRAAVIARRCGGGRTRKE